MTKNKAYLKAKLLATVLDNPWIPHDPTIKQAEFLLLDNLEAFYGGAAGGGKSDALLAAALMYVDIPSYAAAIFRKTFADLSLPGAIMDRSFEWLGGTGAKWYNSTHTWQFPSGATLTFAYLDHEQHKFRYQSAEFQYIGFDELTQFTESQYTYLFSRLRRLEGSNIPIRMRSASNPGGVGHVWVKQRFIVEGQEKGRPFIPALIADNPYLDQRQYRESLSNLDPVTRLQLEQGDWEVRNAGGKFQREWFEIVDDYPKGGTMVRYWDLAATEPKPGDDADWSAGALMTVKDGVYYIINITKTRTTPRGVENLVRQTAELDGKNVLIYMEQEPGSSGKSIIDHYTRRILTGFYFKANRPTGDKEIMANPVSSQAEAGNIKLVRGPWINDYLDEATLFPFGAHDDQVDAVSGAFAILSSKHRIGHVNKPKGW